MEPPEKDNSIEPAAPIMRTPIGRVTLEDGVVVLTVDLEVIEPTDIERHIDLVLEISQQQGQIAMPVLMDLGNLKWIGWKARICGAELLRPEWNTRFAMLWRNPVQKVIASFFLGMNKPLCPSIMSGSRQQAMTWLQEVSRDGGPPEPDVAPCEPSGRLAETTEALVRIGLGELPDIPAMTDERDELDGINCGLAMLTEELASLFAERENVETEGRKHRKRLELLVEERTSEVQEVNESLKREIEEHKAVEKHLQQVNQELNEFAHKVSHDLKGPLSVVQSASETLSLVLSPSDSEADHSSELADIISRNTLKATTLVEDLLALAEAGQLPTEVTEVNVGEVIELVREEAAARIAERGVALRVSDDLGTISASQTQIYQVFTNLITNMIEHSSCESPVIEISALPSQEPVHRYLVRDNGEGIPSDDLKKIFEPFYKGEGGRTGLGLSTVKKITEVYGGDIVAYNDRGACFEVTLKDFNP